MTIDRRRFLGYAAAGTAAAAAAVVAGCGDDSGREGAWWRRDRRDDWDDVRRLFTVDREYIHLAGLLIASHPRPVAAAIAERRTGLDANPALYVEGNNSRLEDGARRAAASYLGVSHRDVALTDSTTMGIALVYNGVSVRPDQELLTTTHDYYSTHESLRLKAQRSGATVRMVEPFANAATATAGEITDRILAAVRPSTRVVALTWVHSWTGIKIPVRAIADGLADRNAGRAPSDRVLLGLDGVHGLGVEDHDLTDLGCDFFMAGTHKWLFAPRGTGILWGRPGAQDAVTPTIPTFSDEAGWGGRMTPGGFKAFEHVWSMADAFELHEEIGRSRIAGRIRELNRQCKEGLARMDRVTLHTPMDDDLSAGIVSFDVDGLSARQVVDRLEQRNIIASTTPYDPPHARLTPGLLNTPAEIDATLAAIAEL
jgi:isopenicillin-N epimerase